MCNPYLVLHIPFEILELFELYFDYNHPLNLVMKSNLEAHEHYHLEPMCHTCEKALAWVTHP
jgi:hypothetical protein